MENNINIDEKTRNEIIYNFIKNLNDIKTKSLNIKIDKYNNHIDKDLLKEKDKKIENLQKQCEELKKQLERKNESEKKNNDDVNIKNSYTNNMNNEYNTSTNFPVKHEIKKVWEEFALVSILDAFIDYESEPEKIFHLISEMILLMDKLINDLCLELYEKVSLSLNIPIKDKKFIYDIEKISRPLIKEHLNTIFIDTENRPFIDNYIYLFKNSLKTNNFLMSNKKDKDTIEEIINGEEFTNIVKKIKDILLYTKFNDQKLFFKIEPDIKKRNVEKIILNSLNDKKKYLIINDNNLNNCQAIVILNPPVMKNGFPLNNDFKSIIMILNENNYLNNDIEKNIMNHTYEICANSFSIYDNNVIENSEDKRNNIINNYNNMNNMDIYNNISMPATRNNDNKNKIKLRLELKTSLPTISKVIENENEKSKRTYREKNINYFNNNILQNNNNKKMSINRSINNNMKNINSTFVKDHKPLIGNIYLKTGLNKNSFCNFNPQVQELLYDSLLQSEYANSPKNLSNDSLIPEQDILISINNDKIKNFDNSDLIRNYNNINYDVSNKKRASLINRKNIKRKSSTNSKRNLYIMNKKRIEKKMSNHSDKNINKKISNNEIIKYGRHHHIFRDICSTEINHNSHNSYNLNDDSGYLKKNRTVKEMNKRKTNLKDENYIFPINYDYSQYISENKLLYQNFGKKNINKNRNDMNLLKEHLKIKKKKLKYNNKISSNYNSSSNKCEKNNSFKHKMKKLNNDYKNDQFNIQRILHYSPASSNITFTSSKNNYNNIVKNRINKNMIKREDNNNYNNSNIRNNNSSYNNNNGNINKTQSQASSTIMKNSTINTGFKIKNVNINYFNIMQPSDLFFNQQRTNRSKSRQNESKQNNSNISNQNNLKNYKKNNNLKANNYSNILLNLNSNDNSLKTEKSKKEKKVRLTKLSETRKNDESCLSNDIKNQKIRLNEYKKLKTIKQIGNEMARNNNNKRLCKIGNNFSLTNNKQVSFIRIPSKISNNNSKQKNENKKTNSKQKKIEKRNNHVDNNSCTNKKINNDNYYFNSQNKMNVNYNYDNQNILYPNNTKHSSNDIIINRNNQNSPYFPKKQKSFAQKIY